MNSVFVYPGSYSWAVDAFLEISAHYQVYVLGMILLTSISMFAHIICLREKTVHYWGKFPSLSGHDHRHLLFIFFYYEASFCFCTLLFSFSHSLGISSLVSLKDERKHVEKKAPCQIQTHTKQKNIINRKYVRSLPCNYYFSTTWKSFNNMSIRAVLQKVLILMPCSKLLQSTTEKI